ncbi:hypothetical protein Tco_1198712 [Tanacetum coccineum]
MRKQRLLYLVLGGNQRVEFSRLLVLDGFQLERYSNLARPRLTVNPHMVPIQILLIFMKASDNDNSGPVPQLQNVSPSADTTVPSQQELDLLFGPLHDKFFNAGTSSINNSSSPTKNSKQQYTPPTTNIQSSIKPTTPTNVNAEENNDNQAEDAQFQQDEFINPFYTSV